MTKKFVSMFLALAMCLSLAAPAFAAEEIADDYIREEESASSDLNPGFTEVIFDGAGNSYSPAVFPTLAAAKAHFGYDWTYGQCYKVHGGFMFNCYYIFTDQTRCYFNVLEW